tara:strand:- start:8081 stop:9199 length:1119 start_codon:yes stop_codon:yes gene_type:complete
LSYVGVIKKQEEAIGYQNVGDTGFQVPIRLGPSRDKFTRRPLGEIDEDLARRSTVQSTISGEPARGFKEAKFKPRSTVEAAAYGVTPAVGAELPRGVTREQIYNLAGKYGEGLGRAADIASKLYGGVRGLTALQRGTASGQDALSAIGSAALQGYTTAQTLAPVAVRAGTDIGSRFGRDVALAGAEPEPKPQPTIAEPTMAPPTPSPTSPTFVLNPEAVAANVERYNREIQERDAYNELLRRKKELDASLEVAPKDSQGNPLFDKFREQEKERAKLQRELNQRALSNPALGIDPVGPATPPPVASPTLPPKTTYNEELMQGDIKTFTDMGSSIPKINEISEIPSTSLEEREKTPEEIQMEKLEEFAKNNQTG